MLNDYALSALLGIVEGLTEFLPVSSTAHLRLAQLLAKNAHLTTIDMDDAYWKMYTVVIQLGAILCLPVYFAPRIKKFVGTFPRGERGDRTVLTHPLTLVMVAFVVTSGPAFLLTKKIGENLDNFWVMGTALLVGGVAMWVVDALFGRRSSAAAGYRTENMEQVTLLQSVWVGACQILSAVFPGTSRSMCTIAAGQTTGMSRAAALEFSFFVSIPTMAAATLWTLLKSFKPKAGDPFSPKSVDAQHWAVLAIGFAVSFVVALGVVAWFMSWVRRRGFVPFAVYRIVVGAAVLWWAFKTHAG